MVYNIFMYLKRIILLAIVIISVIIPVVSYAVIPPDFILNISSQFTQFFSLVALSLVAASGAMLHFFKDVLSKTVKWVISICLIFITLIVFYFIFFYSYSFYNDRLTILYKDNNQKDQALMVELYRIEKFPFIYRHYYVAKSIDDENNKKYSYTKAYSRTGGVLEKNFIKKFLNNNNYNTLNEDYFINLEVDNKEYIISLPDLHGDFILNNSLPRLTYINMGQTNISIDNTIYPAQFLLTKNLSNDSSKSVADDTLESITNHEFLADTEGGLYLVDSTFVENPKDDYTSHLWVLCKKGSFLEKRINEVDVKYNVENKIISINNICFNQNVIIDDSNENNNKNSNEYLITGQITDNNKTKKIKGLNLYVEN